LCTFYLRYSRAADGRYDRSFAGVRRNDIAYLQCGAGGRRVVSGEKHMRIQWRYCVYFFFIAVAAAVYWFALSAVYSPTNPQEFWKYAGLFLGPTLIALGWVVTNEINTRNSRKQHTINLIMQYFTNSKRIDDKECLNTKLPYPEKLVEEGELRFDDRNNRFLRTVVRELNYLDFLSSAVLHREIDGQLFERVFVTILPHTCYQFRAYIDHWRKKDKRYWEDLIKLNNKWVPSSERL
jgi:hypothetical protein